MPAAITASQLPEVIIDYLDRRVSEDATSAADLFTDDAVVFDEGHTYTGPEQIREWIRASLTKYRYTVTFLSAEATDDDRFTVTNRLQGNFPGGTVDLTYGFQLADEGRAIKELVFA
jgi:ketosteroid isomerase-like protein